MSQGSSFLRVRKVECETVRASARRLLSPLARGAVAKIIFVAARLSLRFELAKDGCAQPQVQCDGDFPLRRTSTQSSCVGFTPLLPRAASSVSCLLSPTVLTCFLLTVIVSSSPSDFSFEANMSFLDKFRTAAQKAGVQANAFAQQTGRAINEQAATARAGFSLPKECDRAAKILQAFLADPDHPDSALNSIPKAVLQQAKGLAVFSVIKAVSPLPG